MAPETNLDEPKKALLSLADRLDQYLVTFDSRHDSRAVFTYAYVQITHTLAENLAIAGFDDPSWVVSLAQHFAAHYIEALETWDYAQDSVPPAWQVVFSTIQLHRTSVLEDLLFSMSAHIIHDLPLSLIEVGMTGAPGGQSRISDFHRVNDVLAKAIEPIADGVTKRYEPFFRWLDRLEQQHTLFFTNYGFRVSRGMAWYNADRLSDPNSQQAAQASLSNSVAALVDDVRNPPAISLRIIFWALRFVAALFRRWPSPSSSPT